jgi:hypothetical protein
MRLPYSLHGALLRRHPYGCSATLATRFLIVRMITRKVVMNMVEGAATASNHEMNASRIWVKWPYGHGAGEALAHRFSGAGEPALRWNTCGKERRAGCSITCSKRSHRELSCGNRRRRLGVSSAPFSSLGDAEEGKKGKQDKGSVSRPCISNCLHILFSGDSTLRLRDSPARNGGNLSFPPRNRETLGHSDA